MKRYSIGFDWILGEDLIEDKENGEFVYYTDSALRENIGFLLGFACGVLLTLMLLY